MIAIQLPRAILEYLTSRYAEYSLALIGCRASGESYPVCEYDVLAVGGDKVCHSRVALGGFILDLLKVPSKELTESRVSLLKVALLDMLIISDPDWRVASMKLQSEVSRMLLRRMYVEEQLEQVLTEVGRCEEALSRGEVLTASFWLEASAYSCGRAMVARNLGIPRPSHLIEQLQKIGELDKAVAQSMGLDLATVVSVVRRLEALKYVSEFSVKLTGSKEWSSFSLRFDEAYPFTEYRARYLMESARLVGAYGYVSLELIEALKACYELKCAEGGISPLYDRLMSELLSDVGDTPSLKDAVVKAMGLRCDERIINECSRSLHGLAKRMQGQLSVEQK